MSRLPLECHSIIGSIDGTPPDSSWVDDAYTSHIDVCVELHEGQRLAYVGALSESGTTVRVDLDRDGWQRLRELASEVCMRIDAANISEEDTDQ